MKIVFMGSAAFAVPSLHKILESEHEVIAVITQPDKPAGRGLEITACPVAAFAREHNLFLFQPEKVRGNAEFIEKLKKLQADLFVVVAYGKILPKEVLDIPLKGCVNVHSSLLPKYRGPAPINWAIINGDTETGVTTMFMNEKMDEGDIIHYCTTSIDECETAQDLHDRLAILGSELLQQTLEAVAKNEAEPFAQPHHLQTYAPMLKREDGHINWQQPAKVVYNRFRGLTPWPGAFCFVDGKRLHIHEAAFVDEKHTEKPGSILSLDKAIVVACKTGKLYLLEVQLEGKKRMAVQDFLRGNPLTVGTLLT